MISFAILAVIYGFIYALTLPFRALDDVSLPASFTDSVNTASSYLIALDTYIPVVIILALLAVFFAYETAYYSMKLINWVIRKIPTIS